MPLKFVIDVSETFFPVQTTNASEKKNVSLLLGCSPGIAGRYTVVGMSRKEPLNL